MKVIDDLPIGRKLIGSFLLIVIILIIVGISGMLGVSTLNSYLEDTYDDHLIPISQLGKVNGLSLQIRGDLYRYILVEEDRPSIRKSIESGFSQFEQGLTQIAPSMELAVQENPALKEDLEKSQSALIAAREASFAVMKSIDEGNLEAAIESMGTGDAFTTGAALFISLDNIIKINEELAAENNKAADQAFAMSNLIIIVLIIVSVIISLALGLAITRSIKGPLAASVQMLQEMSSGHVSGTRLHLNRKDEIGVLADTMDDFSDALRDSVVRTLDRIADGDVTLSVVPRGENDEIAHAMVRTINSLKELAMEAGKLNDAAVNGDLSIRGDSSKFQGGYRLIIEGMNATLDAIVIPVQGAMQISASFANGDYTARIPDDVVVKGDFIAFREALDQIGIAGSQAIGDVKNGVETLTAGMEETNASVEEVASSTRMLAQSSASVSALAERSGDGIRQTMTAMEDLSNTVSAVATKAEQASSMANQTVELSEKGVALAGKAEKGMEAIMLSTEETGVIIEDITSQMDEIGNIVDVITGIAEQTGLLALNAAIEAARAGDAGMGFAVVADEVKSLALESQKSAENIATIIENLQKKSRQVSETMQTATEEVKVGNLAVIDTLEVFNQIVEAINVVHANMSEVAGATEEQAAVVEEITASVNEIGDMVQGTAKEAVDSAAATEEVTAAIDQITQAINDAAASVQKIADEMEGFKV